MGLSLGAISLFAICSVPSIGPISHCWVKLKIFLDLTENLGKLHLFSSIIATVIDLCGDIFLEFGCFPSWPQNNKEKWSKLSNQEWSCHSNGWLDVNTVDYLHIPLYLGHFWSIFLAINCPVSQATWRLPCHLRWFPWGLLLAPTKHSRGTIYSFTLGNFQLIVDSWHNNSHGFVAMLVLTGKVLSAEAHFF